MHPKQHPEGPLSPEHERYDSEVAQHEGWVEEVGGAFDDADRQVSNINHSVERVLSHPDATDSERAEARALLTSMHAAQQELATGLGTVLDRIRHQVSKKTFQLIISGLLLGARTGEAQASGVEPDSSHARPPAPEQQPRRVGGLREMLKLHGIEIEERKSTVRPSKEKKGERKATAKVVHELPALTPESESKRARQVVDISDAEGNPWRVEIERIESTGDEPERRAITVYEETPKGHRCYAYADDGNLQWIYDREMTQTDSEKVVTEVAMPMKPIPEAASRFWLSDEDRGVSLLARDQYEQKDPEDWVKTETHVGKEGRKDWEKIMDPTSGEVEGVKQYHYADETSPYPDRAVLRNPDTSQITQQEEFHLDLRRTVETYTYDDLGRVKRQEKYVFFGKASDSDYGIEDEFAGKVVTVHAYDPDHPWDHQTTTIFRSLDNPMDTNAPDATQQMTLDPHKLIEATSLWEQEKNDQRRLAEHVVRYEEGTEQPVAIQDLRQNRRGENVLESLRQAEDGKMIITNYDRIVEIPPIPTRADVSGRQVSNPSVKMSRSPSGEYDGIYDEPHFSAQIIFEGEDPERLRVKEVIDKADHGHRWTVDGDGDIKTLTLPDSTVLEDEKQIREYVEHEAAAGRLWPKIDDQGRVREVLRSDGGRQVYSVDDDGTVEQVALYDRGVDSPSDRFQFAYDEGGHTQTRHLIFLKGGNIAVQVYDHNGKTVGSRTIEQQDQWFQKIQPGSGDIHRKR
jgi:hypothetical protein